jgi:hypothetical protein
MDDLVPDSTMEHVFERDGDNCWLCNREKTIELAHQIDATAYEAFYRFHEEGTLPSAVTPSHADNLIPLCSICYHGYHSGFPDWVLVPDRKTLQKYIEHEKADYEERLGYLGSNKTMPPRTLPLIDRNKVLYHPLMITSKYCEYLGCRSSSPPNWPKRWLGEPTTVIHRAARHGLLDVNSGPPVSLPHTNAWQLENGCSRNI